jgi:uncharacterized membrane protein (UPF0127 family)
VLKDVIEKLDYRQILIKGIITSYFILALILPAKIFVLFTSGDGTLEKFVSAVDYKAMVTGAQMIVEKKAANLYNVVAQGEVQNKLVGKVGIHTLLFRGSIFQAITYLPVTLLPYFSGYKFFVVCNFGLWLFVVLLFSYKEKHDVKKLLFNIAILVTFIPALNSIVMGQTSVTMFLFVLLIYALLQRKHFFLSGLAFLGLFIKPQFLVLVAPLILLRPWMETNDKLKKFVYGVVVATVIFALANFGVFGLKFPGNYLNFIKETETAAWGSPQFNSYSLQALVNLAAPYSDHMQSLNITLLVTLIIFSFLLFYLKKYKTKLLDNFTIFDLSILITPFLGIHFYSYDLVILIIPIARLLNSKFLTQNQKLALGFLLGATFIGTYSLVSIIGMALLLLAGLFLLQPNNENLRKGAIGVLIVTVMIHIGFVSKYVSVRFKDKYLLLQTANTRAERAKGLMNVKELPENGGMLFDMGKESKHTFWMKNTLIPLDMVWLDKNYKVVDVTGNAIPCKKEPCWKYNPSKPAKYVIEVNGGWAAKNGFGVGTYVLVEKL